MTDIDKFKYVCEIPIRLSTLRLPFAYSSPD